LKALLGPKKKFWVVEPWFSFVTVDMGVQGSEWTPDSMTYTVRNPLGSETIQYIVSVKRNFDFPFPDLITVNGLFPVWAYYGRVFKGTLGPGGSETFIVDVAPGVTDWAAGTYSTELSFLDQTHSTITTRRVVVTVPEPGRLDDLGTNTISAVGPVGNYKGITPGVNLFYVSNGGGLPVNLRVSTTAPWITLYYQDLNIDGNGEILAEGPAVAFPLPPLTSSERPLPRWVKMGFNEAANDLPVGTYTAVVNFDNLTNSLGSTKVTVTLELKGGVLSVTPATDVRFEGPEGGPFTSQEQVYTLSNTGVGLLRYEINQPQSDCNNWFRIGGGCSLLDGYIYGTLAAGAQETVRVVLGGGAQLAAGTYTDTITFTNELTGDGTTSRTVTLVVTPKIFARAISSPTPGATLTSTTATFTGGHASGELQHYLYVGTTKGSYQIKRQNLGTAHSATVSNLPMTGTIYVRYWTRFSSGWKYQDHTYTTPPTVYEDAENSNTAGWQVYDATPAGATIANVYDATRQSRVIAFTGSGRSNGYKLYNSQGQGWNNTRQFVVEWSMAYAESFTVYLSVQTTAGHRYIYYNSANTNNLGTAGYVHHGLGRISMWGQWRTFTRDLQADLTEAQPGVQITKVNAFLIRGSGRVDDIRLHTKVPSTISVIPSGTRISPVHLQASNGQYVVAEGSGGGAVNANRSWALGWETFTLIDINGGSLMSGDSVHFQTFDGEHYFVAEGGGGREVKADRTVPLSWETFIIRKVGGSGAITHGDPISLQANNGQYMVAEGGGGGVVNANRDWVLGWERFTYRNP